jgi:putative hydrolase of the HAD superfamily
MSALQRNSYFDPDPSVFSFLSLFPFPFSLDKARSIEATRALEYADTVIDLVALDADDTLWHNEPHYTSAREQFCQLIEKYAKSCVVDERLYEVEMRNLQHFGYGVKGFVLSMIETAIELTEGRLENADVQTIIGWGRDMLSSPVMLLEGVSSTIKTLAEAFPLILVTKGDLLHQESKLARSGLGHHFKGIEIVSEKDAHVYRRVMQRYAVQPDRFVMVGNSLRSDILPVLEAGGHAVYVPYEGTWVHERVEPDRLADMHYHEIVRFSELPAVLRELSARVAGTR